MTPNFKFFLSAVLSIFLFSNTGFSQQNNEPDHSYKPLVVKLNEDGSKYLRFIIWNQLWVSSNNLAAENSKLQLSTSIRRSRLLAYAQISPKFLVLTHFGLNSLSSEDLTSLGSNGNAPQLFLHGAWGELQLTKQLYLGGGLHYWNGLTRSANQSTLNFTTLDQSRPFNAWHSLGITDQFARHLGIYLKGAAGKFEYRFAWNNPGKSPLGDGQDYSASFWEDRLALSNLTYTGVSTPDASGDLRGNSIFAAYVKYNLWENESTKLPYYVGTYLGKKKVLAIGTGFFLHPNGMYNAESAEHGNVAHFAIDAFMELPTQKGALNTYLAFQKFNYGKNYISRWGGTGNAIYGQLGYFLSHFKIMPYVAYSASDYEGAEHLITSFDAGINYYINGHNCKLTAEYHSILNDYREASMTVGEQDLFSQFRLQLQVFL